MYDLVDRPVSGLDQGSRLLVWAMRCWVQSMGERRCPGHALAPAFAGLTVLAGLQPFMQMMALFNRHGLENFQFCTLHCEHVSEHEALILTMLCNIRGPMPKAAKDTLALLVEDDSAGPVLDAMVRLGAALGAVGMNPHHRPSAAKQPPLPRQQGRC